MQGMILITRKQIIEIGVMVTFILTIDLSTSKSIGFFPYHRSIHITYMTKLNKHIQDMRNSVIVWKPKNDCRLWRLYTHRLPKQQGFSPPIMISQNVRYSSYLLKNNCSHQVLVTLTSNLLTSKSIELLTFYKGSNNQVDEHYK